MKKFLKTICVGGFYYYCIYKITDAVGRIYYLAEPVLHGATRIAEREEDLRAILEHDINKVNQFQQRIR